MSYQFVTEMFSFCVSYATNMRGPLRIWEACVVMFYVTPMKQIHSIKSKALFYDQRRDHHESLVENNGLKRIVKKKRLLDLAN